MAKKEKVCKKFACDRSGDAKKNQNEKVNFVLAVSLRVVARRYQKLSLILFLDAGNCRELYDDWRKSTPNREFLQFWRDSLDDDDIVGRRLVDGGARAASRDSTLFAPTPNSATAQFDQKDPVR